MIVLTNEEKARIRKAWESLEDMVDYALNEGGSEALPRLLRDAFKASRDDRPEAMPRWLGPKAEVLRAVARGIEEPEVSLAAVATSARWWLLGRVLGCSLSKHFAGVGDLLDGANAYAQARSRWLESLK